MITIKIYYYTYIKNKLGHLNPERTLIGSTRF